MSYASFHTLYTRLFVYIALLTKLSLKSLIAIGLKKDEAADINPLPILWWCGEAVRGRVASDN